MKRVVALLVIISLASATNAAAGQTAPTPPEDRALHVMGKTEMGIGAFAAAIGTLMLVTGPRPAVGDRQETYAGALLIGGGILMWSGHRHLQKAKQPSMRFGVVLGPQLGVLVQRRW
jgi:hypothetical protein